ncbi:Alanyl-tRNA editing protein AlaX-M [Stagonosporopsis vannaccii]|nr:Alanyl-tRNA editing protein AlaX-M [Stagonosporopsis vannaccii]
MAMTRTEAVYQKDGQKYTHTSPISSVQPLSSLAPDVQTLFKPPPEGAGTPYVLTAPSTIFHAQGGGQPSDTGTITAGDTVFAVHQVRAVGAGNGNGILHMGTFEAGTTTDGGARGEKKGQGQEKDDGKPTHPGHDMANLPALQAIDIPKRKLHSRLHTAGHILGLAAAQLKNSGVLDPSLVDGKASHYPGAAFVEFAGLIPGDKKADLQAAADELVRQDLPVCIHFWDEARARRECTGVLESFKQDADDGVRVVEIGHVGSYPCGGTHVLTTGQCGRVVVRNIKRQKGITKVSYEVQDA